MTQVSIVYFSGYGHTKRVADTIVAAMDQAGAKVHAIVIDAEGNIPSEAWDTLAASDAIVFGSPTYMGMVAWQFKKFADASSKVWFTQGWKNKLMAGFTNSASMNGDKASTLAYLFTLSMQHSGIWVGAGMMPSNSKAAQRNDVNFLGSFPGLITQSPSDSSPEEGPPPGDLETAKHFAERVLSVASLFEKSSESALA
jgi:NAD(P)H dehydrogenase (quinone)